MAVTERGDAERFKRKEEGGGDPSCWAHLLCPECGAVPDSADEKRCPRCGAEFPDEAR